MLKDGIIKTNSLVILKFRLLLKMREFPNINVEKKSVWHTLQGVKLFAKPNIPGVYIHNGKKIIVR